MHQFDILPFPIGSTWSAFGSPAVTDGQELEGKMYWVEDMDYSNSPAKPRAYDGKAGGNKYKLVRIVRNEFGGTTTVQARRLCTYKLTAYGKQVDGYATTLAQECFPADEFLTAGVPIHDLFYIVLGGFAECLTSLDGASAASALTGVLTTQVIVVSQTAVTSQATTAGRVYAQDLASGVTGSTLAIQIQNKIGVALSARTTNQTNTAILVHIYNDW